MARHTLLVSESIQMLSDVFEPHRTISDNETIVITGMGVRRILSTLRTLRHLALLQEREIGALRQLETSRGLRDAFSSELTSAMEAAPGDNVIRPDFRGKS